MQPRRLSVLATCLVLLGVAAAVSSCSSADEPPISPWATLDASFGSGGSGGFGGFGGTTGQDANPYQTRDATADADAADVSAPGDVSVPQDSSTEASGGLESGSDAPPTVDGGKDATEGGPPAGCVTTEKTETHCGDGVDNDCDGTIDCEDYDCRPTSAGGSGASCDVPFVTSGKKCEWLGRCICPPNGATGESACNDGKDDDCDGKVDCLDEDCQPGGVSAGNRCDALAHICAATPTVGNSYCTVCTGGEDHEQTCGDGKDNDCDGKIDCLDEDCASVSCGPGAGQFCLNATCTDVATAYVIKITAARAAIPADGIATDAITVQLTNSKQGKIDKQPITFTITGQGHWAQQDAGNTTLEVLTDNNGIAKATFLSDAAGGAGEILATLTSANVGAETTVTMPPLDNIKVASVENFLMGVKTSGYQEQNKIAFQLYAPNNEPYPEGLALTFSHQPLGGSTIGPPPTPPCSIPGCTVSIPGATNGAGKATVTMYSGTIAGTRDVAVQATAGGQTKVLNTSAIAIVGAKASGSKITLSCSPNDVPALMRTDCQVSLDDERVNCTVTLADRFNNVLGVSAIASFASEAGLVGPPVATPQYPAANLGLATNYINTNGGKIPIDVRPDPNIDEKSYATDPADPRDCRFVEHNPRDGIASVIAFTQGEEGFVDANGDGSYNNGEPFVDLGEPFVDSNDNNVQNGGPLDPNFEFFLDVNNNGVWDGPNGVWDSATTIWAETRIVYTGRPEVVGSNPTGRPSPSYLSDWYLPLAPGEAKVIDVWFADYNYNVLAPATVFSTGTTGGVTATILASPIMRPCALGGFFFQRLFCDADAPGTGSDGGIPSNCGSACPPLPSTKKCIVRSSLSSFENAVYGRVEVKASIIPGTVFVRAAVNTKTLDLSPSVCTRETDAELCKRLAKNCGSVDEPDNCGLPHSVASCGACTSPLTCGGGGTPNECGCGETDSAFCTRFGKNCGTVTGNDICGKARTVPSCGTCPSPQSCGGGGTVGVCGP
jgi:hypothetical protein